MNDAINTASSQAFESMTALRQANEDLLAALDSKLEADASVDAEATAVAKLEPEIRRFLEQGAATGMLLEYVADRTAAQVILDYWASTLGRMGRRSAPPRLLPFDGDSLPVLADADCPYVGLDAFREPTYFFGRETDTVNLARQVADTPLTVVLGASGSGKSSLVLGGMLPALTVAAGDAWRITTVASPGDAALERLWRALEGFLPPDAGGAKVGAAKVRQDPGQLASLLADADRPPLVIVIDQFEEVFTLCGDDAERQTFASCLAAILRSDPRNRVVLVTREEFRSSMTELLALEPYRDRAWYSMRPLGYEELHAAVAKPAALKNLQFQPGIVDDLVKKVLGQPAALPLLQFTLRRLWDERDRNRITWERYEKVGDPREALAAAANAFHDGLVPQTAEEAKRILLELVRIDNLLEAYRQPVRMSTLLKPGKANTGEVLRLLAEHDFVRIQAGEGGEDSIVEIKHEALIRNWPRFVAWIDEKRMQRRQRLALTQAAEQWDRRGRPPEGLLTGWQLQEAQRQTDLDALEGEFVKASVEAVEREQREREETLRRQRDQANEDARRANDNARQANELAQREMKLRKRTKVGLVVAIAVALLYMYLVGEISDKNERLKEANSKLLLTIQERERSVAALQAEADRLFAILVDEAVHKEKVVQPPGPGNSAKKPIIFLQISDEAQRARAKEIGELLGAGGVQADVAKGIQLVASSPQTTQLRYFHQQDEKTAKAIADLVRKYLGVADVEAKLISGYESKAPPGQYEIWFGRGANLSKDQAGAGSSPTPGSKIDKGSGSRSGAASTPISPMPKVPAATADAIPAPTQEEPPPLVAPKPVVPVRVVSSITLEGGHRIELRETFKGEVSVYVSEKFGNVPRPQLMIYRSSRRDATDGLAEYAEYKLFRRYVKTKERLFDQQVGPERFRAPFAYGGVQYRLEGQIKKGRHGQGSIEFEVYRD